MAALTFTDKKNYFELTLHHRPGNTLTIDLMKELMKCAKTAARGQPPTFSKPIVLVSGLPGVFSMGIDPGEVLRRKPAKRIELFSALAKVIATFAKCGVPVVCDVNGAATAGGAVLAFLGTFLVVGPGVKISFSEVKVGLPLPSFVQCLVETRLTSGLSREAMFLGKNLSQSELVAGGASSLPYQDEAQHVEQLSGLVGRINRIHPDVMAKTLITNAERILGELKKFAGESPSFARFLGDEFLGKSMMELTQNKPA